MDTNGYIPPNMPESRVNEVSISMFVDADLAGDKFTRRSQTWVLIFINKAPIYWYIKSQETVEAFSFGSEFFAAKAGMETIEYLQYKL